jgi:hypothetical protein
MHKNARVIFYGWFRGILDANAVVLHRLIMSDEARFHFSGYVNKQNCQYQSNTQIHSVFRSLYTVEKPPFGAQSELLELFGLISLKKATVVTITST